MADNPPPNGNDTTVGAGETRQFGIYFNTQQNVTVNATTNTATANNQTTFAVDGLTVIAIVGTLGIAVAGRGRLTTMGSFLKTVARSWGGGPGASTDTATIFVVVVSNFGCSDIDVTDIMKKLNEETWTDAAGNTLIATCRLLKEKLTTDQLCTFMAFRSTLGCDSDTYQTTTVWNEQKKNSEMASVLKALNATLDGDNSAQSEQPGQPGSATYLWGKGLINRMTTGGPNGSMAGEIAVDFMDTVTVPKFFEERMKSDRFARYDTTDPVVAILDDAVQSAAKSTAQGLSKYLVQKVEANRKGSRDGTEADRQTATVVKGIKDSMPSTGKTLAQLAVFNALGNPEIAKLDKNEQLRVAYTVANSTRAAVEATGNHVADLYQSDQLPSEEELAAVGELGLGSFLLSVGKTVANGVMQAAPVILNSVANSMSANDALGSNLPPSIMLNCIDGVQNLDAQTKVTLASRIVNGKCNKDATVVTDKAVEDLANRTSQLGSQATLDTFTNTVVPDLADDPTKAQKFRDVALAISTLSPSFSNVTDIGATNLVTDASLQHADSLRQNALEVGMRSTANMIADNPAATVLYKVHLHRLKNGRDVKPRSFDDFLGSAVNIASSIAKTAVPALLSII